MVQIGSACDRRAIRSIRYRRKESQIRRKSVGVVGMISPIKLAALCPCSYAAKNNFPLGKL
jgi:hypothetical protein